MEKKIILHPKLLEFLTRVNVDLIEDAAVDDPDKVVTIMKVNEFLYNLENELLNPELMKLKLKDIVEEKTMNEIMEEIKNNI